MIECIVGCTTTSSSVESGERFYEIDLPPAPTYDCAEQGAMNTALMMAIERVEAAEEAVLVHVLRCDVDSGRYKAMLGA